MSSTNPLDSGDVGTPKESPQIVIQGNKLIPGRSSGVVVASHLNIVIRGNRVQ